MGGQVRYTDLTYWLTTWMIYTDQKTLDEVLEEYLTFSNRVSGNIKKDISSQFPENRTLKYLGNTYRAWWS